MKARRFLAMILTILMVVSIMPLSTVSTSAASFDLAWPCSSAWSVTCMYYYKTGAQHSTRYGYQYAMDIAGGGNVLAAESGTVVTSDYQSGGFGNYIVIKHSNGNYSLYGHLASKSVSAGASVSKGQKIGVMGTTGNSSGVHLHFEYSGADPWKTFFRSKYYNSICYEQNVRSNNNSFNSDKTIVNFIDNYCTLRGGYYYYNGGFSEVSFTSDSKYSSFKGFEGYLITGSNVIAKKSDLTSRAGEIYTTDTCTINDIYTNGYCSVTFPVPSGTITGYVPTSSFLVSTSSSPSLSVAKDYVNLYSSASRTTQIYRVYPDDKCYIVGTSGTSTQLFMPLTKTGGYALGWVSTSEWNATPSTAETLNPGLTALSTSKYAKCYTLTSSHYNVYTSSALSTRGYEGTASSTTWTGEDDEDYIIGVGVNSSGVAYAKINFPVGSDMYTGYVALHDVFVPGKLNGSYRTATQNVVGFSNRPGGTVNNNYWVNSGEKVYLLSQQSGYSQILYPTDTSGVWRIAWCTNSVYESMFKAQTYTVTYNANGGTGAPSAQTKTRDVALTLSSTKPTRTGYSFVGWATSATATTAAYAAGSIYTTEANVTLYAVWRINQYTITYDANGGTDAPAEQTKNYGTTINLSSSIPTLPGFRFIGWSTDRNALSAVYQAGATYNGNEDLTLYAVWEVVIYTFRVIYDANGGSGSMDTSTFSVGDKSYLPKNIFTRDGYEFIGWSTNSDDGIVVFTDQQCVESIVVDNDNETITLYAVWQQISTQIPGDINGDGTVNNKDLTRLMKYLAGEDVEVVTEALDVNGDGSVNNKDLTRLMKFLAGEEVEICIN